MSDIIYLASEEWVTNIISGLTGPTGSTTGFDGIGTQYLSVFGKSDPVTNIAELQNVYNVAKALAPTSDNPVNIIIYPGYYGMSSKLILDTPYINLISSTGNIDVEIGYDGTSVNSDYITLYGIKFQDGGITINGSYPNLYIENCDLFEGNISNTGRELSGTFKNISGNSNLFNGYSKYSGIFENIDMVGGPIFGGSNDAEFSGIFKNITIGGGGSLQGNIFSGTFNNISIINNAEGFNGTLFSGTFSDISTYVGFYAPYWSTGTTEYSGTFDNIVGTSSIFISSSNYSGIFKNIKSPVAFESGNYTGEFFDCIIDNGFNSNNLGGQYYNCVTQGGFNGTMYGTCYNCIGNFSSVQSGAILYNCVGAGSINVQSGATLYNCVGVNSFNDATLYNCIDGNGKIIGGPTISGVYYQEVTGVTSVTVSLDSPLNNTGYTINITPASLDSAIQYYITNLTLSSFDIIYVSTITGIISFYWIINKS